MAIKINNQITGGTDEPSQISRDLKFDGLKFLLIFLVVLGHVEFYDEDFHIKRYIFSFHMPVFVFLSGYFTSLKHNKEKQNEWIKKTLIIYAIAQLTQLLVEFILEFGSSVITGAPFDYKPLLNRNILVFPKFALWYLLCLIYWRFVYWRLSEKIKDTTLLLLSVLFAILAGFVPLDYAFSFQRAFAFFPFFVSGVIFKKRNLLPVLERMPVIYAFFALLIGLLASRYMPTYLPVFPYDSFDQLLLRVAQTGLGFFLCATIIRIARCRFTELFSKYGSKSLWIYVGHTYFIIIGTKLFNYLNIHVNIFMGIVLAMLYCMTIIFIEHLYSLSYKKA